MAIYIYIILSPYSTLINYPNRMVTNILLSKGNVSVQYRNNLRLLVNFLTLFKRALEACQKQLLLCPYLQIYGLKFQQQITELK